MEKDPDIDPEPEAGADLDGTDAYLNMPGIDDIASSSEESSEEDYEAELHLHAPKPNLKAIAPGVGTIREERKKRDVERRQRLIKKMLTTYRADNPDAIVQLAVTDFDKSYHMVPHGEVSKRFFEEFQKARPFDRYARRIQGVDSYTIAEDAARAKRKADGLEKQRLQVQMESRRVKHMPVFEFDKVHPVPPVISSPWKIGIKPVVGAPVGFAADPANVTKSEGNEVHFPYDGEWEHGMMNGEGMYQFSDGTKYEGSFYNNRPDELGSTTYVTGTTYKGRYKRGYYQGYGVLACRDGSTYEGEWKKGKRHGQGKLILESGLTYEGMFKDGKPHGRGKVHSPLTKYSYEGTFHNVIGSGSIYGSGALTYPNGKRVVRFWPQINGVEQTLPELVKMMEKEKEDLSLKKKADREIVHGVTRSFRVDEYVAQVRIDLHSQRAQEKRAKIAEMMRVIKEKKEAVREAKLRALAGDAPPVGGEQTAT